MSSQRTLDEVRTDIDSIDDAIQDLLIRRTALVEEVRSIKRDWRVKIQPSREAEICYRLVRRHHGAFPKRDLVAMWRILICATLSFEGPFSVAVHISGSDGGLWDLARDHFGPCTPMIRRGSTHEVLEAVHRQEAVVGVLPIPRHDDPDPWWPHLLRDGPDTSKVIARLPFVQFNGGTTAGSGALVICPVTIAPTGRDRSLLGARWDGQRDRDPLTTALRNCGLVPVSVWRYQADERVCHLAEVEGWLAPDDGRLRELREKMNPRPEGLMLVGGYAMPLDDEMLAPRPADARNSRSSPAATEESAAAL